VTGWGHGGPLPDRDAFDKVLLDALVRARLLLDDGERGLAGRLEVELVRGNARRTEVLLRDAPVRRPRGRGSAR
jgi:hypothetical protein